MPTRFIKKPPTESRVELKREIEKKLGRLEMLDAIEYLLSFFTAADLKLILEEIEEGKAPWQKL